MTVTPLRAATPGNLLDECRTADVAQRVGLAYALCCADNLAAIQVRRSAGTASLPNATPRDEAALIADVRTHRAIQAALEVIQAGDGALLLTDAQKANLHRRA